MPTDQEHFADIPDNLPHDLEPPSDLKPSKTKSAFKSPALRIGLAIVAFVVLGLIGLNLISSGKKILPESSVSSGSAVKDIPGTDSSPAYADAVRTRNSQRLEEAIETGGSAIPTPVATQQNLPTQEPERTVDIDPITAFQQALTPPPAPAPAPVPSVVGQGSPGMPAARIDPAGLAVSMQQQMQGLMGGWAPRPLNIFTVETNLSPSNLEQLGGTESGSSTQPSSTGPATSTLIIPAGSRAYAQLETEANSDVPTPVVARILSGPLTGGRAIGNFQSTEEYLVLQFSVIARGKEEYQVQAIAIDPHTQLAGMATDTDPRYMQRIVLPGAAAFMQGFAQAFVNSRSTTTTFNDNFIVEQKPKINTKQQVAAGLAKTADVAANILEDDAAQIKPLVRVRAGTPMSILFLGSVRKGNTTP